MNSSRDHFPILTSTYVTTMVKLIKTCLFKYECLHRKRQDPMEPSGPESCGCNLWFLQYQGTEPEVDPDSTRATNTIHACAVRVAHRVQDRDARPQPDRFRKPFVFQLRSSHCLIVVLRRGSRAGTLSGQIIPQMDVVPVCVRSTQSTVERHEMIQAKGMESVCHLCVNGRKLVSGTRSTFLLCQ